MAFSWVAPDGESNRHSSDNTTCLDPLTGERVNAMDRKMGVRERKWEMDSVLGTLKIGRQVGCNCRSGGFLVVTQKPRRTPGLTISARSEPDAFPVLDEVTAGGRKREGQRAGVVRRPRIANLQLWPRRMHLLRASFRLLAAVTRQSVDPPRRLQPLLHSRSTSTTPATCGPLTPGGWRRSAPF